MGGMLSQPVTDKRENQGEGLGLCYGLSSMQGWRSEMEDAHDVRIGLKYGLEDWSYFAVFDGHAGKRAAAFAAWNLLEFILRDGQFKLDIENLPKHVCVEPDLDRLHDIIRVENTKSTNISVGENSSEVIVTTTATDKQPIQSLKGQSTNQGTTKTSDHTTYVDRNDPSKSSKTQDNIQSSSATTTTTSSSSSSSPSPSSEPSPSLPPAPTNEQTNVMRGDSQQGESNVNSSTHTDKDSVPTAKSTFCKLPVPQQLDVVESAIKSGFLKIDQSMRDTARDMSGCTAICTLISPTHLFIANCGDSRAVLYDGTTKFATEDHKPLNPKERKRIIKAGGCATQRINGTLAVSRALGDFEFKKDQQRGPCEQLVSPEPEVTVIERSPEDRFLVLACDGIWDVMDSNLLCEFIDYKLQVEPSLQNVCSAVLDVCLHKGSRDNMSIIIVAFENAPKFSEENRQRDLKNDERILEVVRKFGEKHEDFNEFFYALKGRFYDMRRRLEDMNAELPPGAGLEAKYDMLHDLFEKEFEEESESKVKFED